MLLRAEKLSLAHGQKEILNNADFFVDEGEIVGIYGRSGCGKSTLARLLCGVHAPKSGEVYLDGELLVSADRAYQRKKGLGIQPVYQQPYSSLDYKQKIGAGFTELLRYHGFAGSKAEAENMSAELLERVGLEPNILSHRPHQISGGEAQRIALARALVFHPRLLILDEATSMLDVSTQANVLALVKRAMKENGGSVLLISHDRELVGQLCHRIYLFENHELKEKRQ